MQKVANPIGKADFRRRKTKDVGMFFFGPKRKLWYTHIFTSQKSGKIVTKPSLVETKQTFGSSYPTVSGSENCSTTSSPFFHLTRFFSDALSFLYGAISESVYLNFTLMLFLWYIDSVQQFLGSYEVHVFVEGPLKWAILCPTSWELLWLVLFFQEAPVTTAKI